MKTKGAILWEFNEAWSVEEISVEVRIQLEGHLVTGNMPMLGFPVLRGHEGAGIVTDVGPGVDDLAPGDHVVLSFIPSYGMWLC